MVCFLYLLVFVIGLVVLFKNFIVGFLIIIISSILFVIIIPKEKQNISSNEITINFSEPLKSSFCKICNKELDWWETQKFGNYCIKCYRDNYKEIDSQNLIKTTKISNDNTIDHTIIVANDSKKSLGSAVIRGAVGGALLGPVGLVGGAISGKNKSQTTFTIVYKNGRTEVKTVDTDSYEFQNLAKYVR